MNLASIIDAHPDDAVAVISANHVTTYGDLRAQVGAFRGGLARHGVQPGDRVAIVMANNWYFVVAYLAALGVGAVVVPLNPQSPTQELVGELKSVEPRVVCVGPTGSDAFSDVDRAAVGVETVIVPEGVLLPDTISFEDLLVSDVAAVVERTDDDLALLMFTSGTAGAPKAAMLTPRQPAIKHRACAGNGHGCTVALRHRWCACGCERVRGRVEPHRPDS